MDDSTARQLDGFEEDNVAPPRNQGLAEWLLSCPDKGFFVPIESESTDTLHRGV